MNRYAKVVHQVLTVLSLLSLVVIWYFQYPLVYNKKKQKTLEDGLFILTHLYELVLLIRSQ